MQLHIKREIFFMQLLLKEMPLKTAVRLTADITGAPRNALYNTALALRQSESESTPDTTTGDDV